MPGWGRNHLRLVLIITIALAVVLRLAHHHGPAVQAYQHDGFLPVAAAIGLHSEMPQGDALATWINSALYSVARNALSLSYPNLSPVDYAVAFLTDPEGFCALARFAALLAGAITIFLTWRLVSTLIDRPAAVAAAFILAIHPTAVSFTAGIGSGAFSLLLLLCALLIAARIDWANARPVEFAAIGLCLGFAFGGMSLAAVVFTIIMALAIHHTPPAIRRPLAANIALSLACFSIAAALVMPVNASGAEFAHGALIVAIFIAAAHLLRFLRKLLHQHTYSALVLSVGIAAGVYASVTVGPAIPPHTDDPTTHASEWIANHLPDESVVAIHSSLADSVSLPRNAQSLRRDAAATDGNRPPSTLYTLAAIRAASLRPGNRYDVITLKSDRPISKLLDHPQHGARVQYIVLPDDLDAREPVASGQLWFVARFRSTVPDHPGVLIYGTQAAPRATPIHVEWHMRGPTRLAALPAF